MTLCPFAQALVNKRRAELTAQQQRRAELEQNLEKQEEQNVRKRPGVVSDVRCCAEVRMLANLVLDQKNAASCNSTINATCGLGHGTMTGSSNPCIFTALDVMARWTDLADNSLHRSSCTSSLLHYRQQHCRPPAASFKSSRTLLLPEGSCMKNRPQQGLSSQPVGPAVPAVHQQT